MLAIILILLTDNNNIKQIKDDIILSISLPKKLIFLTKLLIALFFII